MQQKIKSSKRLVKKWKTIIIWKQKSHWNEQNGKHSKTEKKGSIRSASENWVKWNWKEDMLMMLEKKEIKQRWRINIHIIEFPERVN